MISLIKILKEIQGGSKAIFLSGNELISDIEQMINKLPEFDTVDIAKSKIKSFV
jgi:hypothetical protein